MQVSLEATSGLERRLTIGVPAADVDVEVEKRLQDAAKNIRLNGFRKGKVPMKVVKQRYGQGVRQEVVGEVMSRSFYEAVQKEDVKPAGQPSIEPKSLDEGKDLEFIATFEVYPEVELSDLSKIEVTQYSAEVTDKDVDNMIDVLRKQQGDWKDVKRKSRKEDRVNINFVGTVDGEEFEGGKAEDQFLILGSNTMIPGFEKGIIGMKTGEEQTIEVTFPEDYQAEELRGKKAEFTVTVNNVSGLKLPDLDDEFFAKYGVEEGGEEKFREEVKANMDRELANALKNKTKTQVMDALVEAHSVDAPKALVANEIHTLRQQTAQQFGGAAEQMDLEKLLPDDMFRERAEQRVALGLVVGEIIKANGIKVDADRVKVMIDEVASTYQQPEDVVNFYHSNQEAMAGVESAVLEDQVVDFVIENAKVTEETSTYDDVIKPAEK